MGAEQVVVRVMSHGIEKWSRFGIGGDRSIESWNGTNRTDLGKYMVQ